MLGWRRIVIGYVEFVIFDDANAINAVAVPISGNYCPRRTRPEPVMLQYCLVVAAQIEFTTVINPDVVRVQSGAAYIERCRAVARIRRANSKISRIVIRILAAIGISEGCCSARQRPNRGPFGEYIS